MWIEISKHVTDAIDSNQKSIESLVKAQENAIEDAMGGNLAHNELLLLSYKANDLDTQLRKFALAINNSAKIEGEL